MNILALIPQTYENLTLFILMMTRISFLLATFILFKREYINAKIIISLSVLLAFYSILITQTTPPKFAILSLGMLLGSLREAFIGLITGLTLNIIFEVFTAVGQILSTQIGLSMATLIDPRLGTITALTFIYNYLAILIFLLLNGHLAMIQLILESFISIPIDTYHLPFHRIEELLIFAKTIFTSSVSLTIAIILSMILTNITVAVMSRFAPQFNVFSVGINFTLVFGLIFIYLTFGILVANGEEIVTNGLFFLKHILSGMK